jgi:hypothetical protein
MYCDKDANFSKEANKTFNQLFLLTFLFFEVHSTIFIYRLPLKNNIFFDS